MTPSVLGFAAAWLSACWAAEPPADHAAAVSAMSARYAAEHPEVPLVSARAVLAAPARYLLVDVRPAAERAVSMLPGAIPLAQWQANPSQTGDRALVLYCTVGKRSGDEAARLLALGVAASNLEGSLLAWTHAGGGLVGPDGLPTRTAHVYGARWNLLAPGYTAVW